MLHIQNPNRRRTKRMHCANSIATHNIKKNICPSLKFKSPEMSNPLKVARDKCVSVHCVGWEASYTDKLCGFESSPSR